MSILEKDIRILASAVMDDVPEGGGAPSGTVIADGASNAVFDDVNDLDTANGNVSARKVFLHVDTANDDKYAGANVIVAAPPGDDLLSLTLFQTDNFFATREEAVARLESYLTSGGAWNGFLYGTHVEGQRMIQIIQRVDTQLPAIGSVLVLVGDEGTASEFRQFVKIESVSYVKTEFTDSYRNNVSDAEAQLTRWVVSCALTEPLDCDFPGQSVTRDSTNRAGKGLTIIRSTVAANAAKYYGYQPLAEVAKMGARSIKAASIYTQLVPSSEIDVPIADATPNQSVLAPIAASGALTVAIPLLSPSASGYVGGAIYPGSLKGASASNSTLADKGNGVLMDGGAEVGTVDYENGVLKVSSGSYGGSFSFIPAAHVTVSSESASVAFSAESRPSSIALTISPPPEPGTLRYSYRAQGQWYTLCDDGSGALRGEDAAFGAGKVNFVTGSVVVTMGALPDAPSLGLLNWAKPLNVSKGFTGDVRGEYRLDLGAVVYPDPAERARSRVLYPTNTKLEWEFGGAARSATISASGVFSGDATGSVSWSEGLIEFSPAEPLNPAAQVKVTYLRVGDVVSAAQSQATSSGGTTSSSTAATTTLALHDMGSSLQATVSGGCVPGTFSGEILLVSEYSHGNKMTRTVRDDGAGSLDLITIGVGGLESKAKVGTIDYSSGVITLARLVDCSNLGSVAYCDLTVPKSGSGYWCDIDLAAGITGVSASTQVVVTSASGTSTTVDISGLNNSTTSLAAGTVRFSLPRGAGARFSPGSLRMTWGGRSYSDRFGRMVYGLNANTGAATDGGAIDYQSGVFTPSDMAGITTTTASLLSSVEQGDLQYITGVCFRSPVAPVRSGQLSVVATLADGAGTLVNATFPTTGYLVSADAVGVADFDAGIFRVWFRSVEAVAGLTHALDVSDYKIPGVTTINVVPALAETVRFNCVGYSYLSVDAEILGINPVRLPSDGRVPIFETGSLVVIHHTAKTAPAAVSNGQTVNVGRTRLARLRVLNADGSEASAGFTADPDAGTVTFSDVSKLTLPVSFEHRIEDFIKLQEVSINGTLKLTRPLTHDFPVGSGVSSALVIGDLRARVSALFDQETWTKSWSDSVIGNPATGTFDAIHYPIEVTNSGAFTERWALVFTNQTSFYVMGEHLGVIGEGNTATDFAPVNPVSGSPYLKIRAAGFGNGFSSGNVIRFNTIGAMAPVWEVLTCQMGQLSGVDFRPAVQVRGNVDRP